VSGDRVDASVKRHLPYFGALRQLSLSCGASAGEAYRFAQFEMVDAPTVVHIERREDGSTVLHVAQLEGPTWRGPGQRTLVESLDVPTEAWEPLQAAVSAARFWELAPYELWEGVDGSAWFLEARRGWSYHVVLRISPPDGPFRQLGELMLSLARPPLPEPKAPR
jgi:hypothetical protein